MEIRQGEFLALLGPSGSGKSTFLNILAGFENATDGKILLGGGDVTSLPPEKRNFGMVFQGYALFPHLTVTQNIAFPLRVRKVAAAEQAQRVKEIIDRVGLAAHSDKYPRQLSGGQQQRVALARALIFSPTMLLLDEPFSALDKNLREQLQFEVSRIHREFGKTFVFVTHDQSEALSMADRVAIFEGGKLQQLGAPKEIYSKPKSEFVARFLGRINIFPLKNIRSEAGTVHGAFGDSLLRASGSATDNCQIAVRPEHTTLSSAPVPGDHNNVRVTIRGVAYHGATVALDLLSAHTASPQVLSLSMSADVWQRDYHLKSQDFWLSWAPEAGLLIPYARSTNS
ncbi:MAG: ABC transporter ATP-binding protein [Ensifer sp. SSB1]|nr:ABC transporter ATP-binding protein [Ensifer sp. SSB1]